MARIFELEWFHEFIKDPESFVIDKKYDPGANVDVKDRGYAADH